MTHHLGGASAFREALIRAVAVAVLIIVGAVIAGVPSQCAASVAHAAHAAQAAHLERP
jgi:hypothetical protein